MRKLKLQMQTSIDCFVAGPNGELDWMVWDWDDELKDHVWELTVPVDLILLGRNIVAGFVGHWTSKVNDSEREGEFARKMVDTKKIVFSRTLENSEWANTEVRSNLVEDVAALKNTDGGDIIAYGGAGMVGSLIKNDLIDEYNLFVNPVAIGAGMGIFDRLEGLSKLGLARSKTFSCGIVHLCYEPKR